MKRIYDWDAKFCLRNYTAADLLALKGVRKLTQTTANSEEEAAAAADAGIDLIMGNAVNAEAVRRGAPNHFYTAAIPMPDHPTEKNVLEAAFLAMKRGADSVYTARGPRTCCGKAGSLGHEIIDAQTYAEYWQIVSRSPMRSRNVLSWSF